MPGHDERILAGPDPDAISAIICGRHPDTIVTTAMEAIFFSVDESAWPNFATIVTTDDHDEGTPSNLTARPGVFRLNVELDRPTFERLVGGEKDPDHTVLDAMMPHPTYSRQRWASILKPSEATFHDVVLPLIDAAHDRLARRRAGRSTTDPV